MKTAIGIDVGGSAIKVVVLNEKGEVLQQRTTPLSQTEDTRWQQDVVDAVSQLVRDYRETVYPMGLCAPGLANEKSSCITYLPGRLPGIENLDWTTVFGMQTIVINDAHAALLAEAHYGVLQGCRNAVLLTLGTGVGGGILLNGELYRGWDGMAGHFGHTCINMHDDEQSIVGMPGSLEYALGNYSIQRRSRGRYASTEDLVKAYREKDPFATWLWLDMIRKLSLAIASLAHSLSPEAVVLAGGITEAGDHLLVPLQSFLDLYEWRPNGKQTAIRLARFSTFSGAIGAAAFALSLSDKKKHELHGHLPG